MLENYHQNSRRYVKSLDVDQLLGKGKKAGFYRAKYELANGCEPFRYKTFQKEKYFYTPCGAIANSIFNGSVIFFIFHFY